MKTKIFILVLLAVSLTGFSQQESKYAKDIETIQKMFNTKNADVVSNLLTTNYTIAGILPTYEEQVLPQVLTQIPKFQSFKIISETEEKDGTRVAVQFIRAETDRQFPCNFLFTKEGKIQEFNILESAQIQTKLGGQ